LPPLEEQNIQNVSGLFFLDLKYTFNSHKI